MLERRLTGEPLQYVLGRWGFRSLDLAVDARVLIPRPETEGVVDLALAALAPFDDRELLVADLGTGSGCIGLAIVSENPYVQMICTDVDDQAVTAARANAAGLGRPARRVEIRSGSWFEALPVDRRGHFDLIISNPPYVAADDELPSQVRDWEPERALIAGPDGLEHGTVLIEQAIEWLRPGGTLVLELGETQLDRAAAIARGAGYVAVSVHRDLAGRDRALVAMRPRDVRVEAPDDAGLDAAISALMAGHPIVIPTDTVYGLAVGAGDPQALDRLFALKRRPAERSIAVLVADLEQAQSLASFSAAAKRAAERYWPGPLTLVVDRHSHVDDSVGRDDGTVGIRCPDQPFVRRLAEAVGPIAATSANLSGRPTPPDAAAAASELDGDVALVVDAGLLPGSPSTVARIDDDGPPTVFREGSVTVTDLLG